jgi:hypothetical protein
MNNSNYIITAFDFDDFSICDGKTGEKIGELDKYGVWICQGNFAKEVIETSNDLPYLQKKYNVKDIIILKRNNRSD